MGEVSFAVALIVFHFRGQLVQWQEAGLGTQMALEPNEQKKIRTRINRYERNFKSRNPMFDDGGGTRFLLGPLYLLVDDLEGALRHYKKWFARKFSDSSDEPLHTLCWGLALHRAGNPKEAVYRLRRAHLANPYLIPSILSVHHGQPHIRRSRGWDDEDYLIYVDPRLISMWSENERSWLLEVWESPAFQELVQTHIDLSVRLDREPVGPTRSALVRALSDLTE